MSELIVSSAPPIAETRGKQILKLCDKYPFLSRISVGKSVLGREIEGIKLGDPQCGVLYAGGFHAQEWLTGMVLMRFAETLCRCIESGGSIAEIDCRKALLARGLVIVPCVNPDGVELALTGIDSAGDLAGEISRISGGNLEAWSANARGVDLNHNYDAGWHIARQLERAAGIDGPAPGRFGGTSPESEPETQAMVALCERFDFRMCIAYHSQGEEIYWKYGEHTPRKSALIAKVLAMSSGYELRTPDAMASHAGFKDWFIEKYHRPGFTVEIGKGKNPLPISQLEPISDRLAEMMMLGLMV